MIFVWQEYTSYELTVLFLSIMLYLVFFSQTFFLLTEISFYLRIQHFNMIAEREYVHIVGYHY